MPTTKQQEREALAKIEKIVAELGVDSYIATAFDGAFGLAEQNIEDDSAFSAKWYINEYYKNKPDDLLRQIASLKSQITCLQSDISAANIDNNRLHDAIRDLDVELAAHRDQSDERIATIISLKAELYDYMKAGDRN